MFLNVATAFVDDPETADVTVSSFFSSVALVNPRSIVTTEALALRMIQLFLKVIEAIFQNGGAKRLEEVRFNDLVSEVKYRQIQIDPLALYIHEAS